MMWIVKQWAGQWVRRCPYCKRIEHSAHELQDNFTCPHCHAIVNPELYRSLNRLSKAISKQFADAINGIQ